MLLLLSVLLCLKRHELKGDMLRSRVARAMQLLTGGYKQNMYAPVSPQSLLQPVASTQPVSNSSLVHRPRLCQPRLLHFRGHHVHLHPHCNRPPSSSPPLSSPPSLSATAHTSIAIARPTRPSPPRPRRRRPCCLHRRRHLRHCPCRHRHALAAATTTTITTDAVASADLAASTFRPPRPPSL